MIWLLFAVGAVAWILELAYERRIGADVAAASVVAITLLAALASARRMALARVAEAALAVAALATAMIWASGADLARALALLEPLGAIAIVMGGLFLIVRQAFRRR